MANVTGTVQTVLRSVSLIFEGNSLASAYRQQRKEVVQCLIPNAVTSLRSPAKLASFGQGGPSAWFSESKKGAGACFRAL